MMRLLTPRFRWYSVRYPQRDVQTELAWDIEQLGIHIYPAVALLVYRVSAAIKLHIVAVVIGIESADIVAGIVAVVRRTTREAGTVPEIISGATVSWLPVVAAPL